MKKPNPFVIGIAAFVAVILGLFVFDFAKLSTLLPAKSSAIISGKTKGNPDASVEMIELSDFQ